MNESNIHRIPAQTVKPAKAGDNVRSRRAVTVMVALLLGFVLAAAVVYQVDFKPMARPTEVTNEVVGATNDAADAAPPAGLTAESAISLAEERLKDGARSGASLAEARRLVVWAAALGAPAEKSDALLAKIDEQLEERWRRGRFAYLHARKLRRSVAADAALRTLRETFPPDHRRSKEIDRLENRP